GEGHYRPQQRGEIYDVLLDRAKQLLKEKRSVVLDGTYLSRSHRLRALELATEQRGVGLFVLCQCDRETSVSRIRKREVAGGAESEARAELYDRLLSEF